MAMNGATKHGRLIRFSVFELNLDSGELFKQGRKLKLQGQPFELLLALLERPGEVATREELKQKVWPSDTVGDFDHGLNRAINKVRDALGDSADRPQFIETLPRRGYRFIGSIQEESNAEPPPGEVALAPTISQAPPEPAQGQKAKPRRTFWIAVAILLAAVVIASLAAWIALRRATVSGPLRVQQLTTNSAENPVWHAVISPDGKYLAYGDLAGIQVRLISTGESHLLPRPSSLSKGDAWFPAAWLPDGMGLLATSLKSSAVIAWKVSVIGGAAAPLRDNALIQSASPDGSLIAFTTGGHLINWGSAINRRLLMDSEIWVMTSRGENAKRVAAGDSLTYFGSVRWSPDGKRIAYRKLRYAGRMFWNYAIESRDLNGGMPCVILSSRILNFSPGSGDDLSFPDDIWWLPDGRIVYAVSETPPNARNSNLWQIAVGSENGKPNGQPARITNLAGFHMEGFSGTGDGRRLVFQSSTDQPHVYVGQLRPDGKLENTRRLTLDERQNVPFAWTPDSKAVIFNSDRTSTFSIYKQALDESVPELVPTGPENIQMARVSADGVSLVYTALFPDESDTIRLMRVPLSGGAPQVVFETKANNFDCPRRPGAECVFSEGVLDRDVVFYGFDPISRKRHQLFRITRSIESHTNAALNWTVSPNGARIAITGDDPQGRIEIRSLSGQIENRIEAKGWPNPLTIDWAADGKAVFVSHAGLIESPSGPIGATLLRVDLEGHVQPLWGTKSGRYTWAVASPDGKYLAIRAPETERNAWMMENF
jgi:DNA-binding winged helix-turn-helix (wHTH) protein/Tol biopolymer transport system component